MRTHSCVSETGTAVSESHRTSMEQGPCQQATHQSRALRLAAVRCGPSRWRSGRLRRVCRGELGLLSPVPCQHLCGCWHESRSGTQAWRKFRVLAAFKLNLCRTGSTRTHAGCSCPCTTLWRALTRSQESPSTSKPACLSSQARFLEECVSIFHQGRGEMTSQTLGWSSCRHAWMPNHRLARCF